MLLVVPALVLATLAGCGGEAPRQRASGSSGSESTPVTTGPTTSAGEASPASTAAVDAGSGVDDAINASGGVVDLGGVQIRHPSGVVVTLERLLVEPSYVVLSFSAANGSPDEVALAGDSSTGITLEVDDPNVVMTYQAPSVNETLEFSSGEVIEAEIVFLGVLPGDTETIDVTFNPEPDPDGDVVEPTIQAVAIPTVIAGG